MGLISSAAHSCQTVVGSSYKKDEGTGSISPAHLQQIKSSSLSQDSSKLFTFTWGRGGGGGGGGAAVVLMCVC